jgi:phospholipase/carboxylesterase
VPVRDIARVILTAFEFPVESGEGTHGYAFFHRFPDRTIDESDITARTPVLADFIQATIASHCVTRAPVAIGFSNGAIMSAALLLMRPGLLAGAILFRPLSPFADNLLPGLDGTPVLIIDGEKDGRRSPGDGLRLAERLIRAGAGVTHHVLPVGHSITSMDREIAKRWLERFECSGAIPASTSPGI